MSLNKPFMPILKIFIVLCVTMGVNTATHAIGGSDGSHGPPSFLTPGFILFRILSTLLIIAAYILIGWRIPVKSKIAKGIIFILLFLFSDYLPQVIGVFGAESTIVTGPAFSINTIILDSIGYIAAGACMGLLLNFRKDKSTLVKCKPKRLVISSVVSMFLFPAIIIVLELFMGLINHNLLGYVAFGVLEQNAAEYYIVFYLCQAISGLLFPIFYRLTEYNSVHKRKWFWFANVYGWMLWAPVVLIVMFFGVPILPTVLFTLILVFAIYIDSFVFSRICKP